MSLKTRGTMIQVVQLILEDDNQVIVQHFTPDGQLIIQQATPKQAAPPKLKVAPEPAKAAAEPKPGKK